MSETKKFVLADGSKAEVSTISCDHVGLGIVEATRKLSPEECKSLLAKAVNADPSTVNVTSLLEGTTTKPTGRAFLAGDKKYGEGYDSIFKPKSRTLN